jgi:hypothetical protein
MDTPSASPQTSPTADLPDCVELGKWTRIPASPPVSFRPKLKAVDNTESQAIKERGIMTFHAVGCTGCHADQQATTRMAAAMAVQVAHPHRFGGTPTAVPASFLYHLGDVVYKKDDARQIPYLIAGRGDHIPVEKLFRPCHKDQAAERPEERPAVVYPPRPEPPAGDQIEVAAFNDTDFGFLRITLDGGKRRLTGEYFAAFTVPPSPRALSALDDSFTLDLRTHTIR